jgi:formylglycine-generating enzyme required for sulfatase activity
VKDLFLGEKGMEDNNLQFVRDMLLERSADKTGVLKIYQQMIKGKPVEDDEQSLNKSHLKLSGVVRRKQTALRVSNLIYQNVFNHNWVKEHLPRVERRTLVIVLGIVSGLASLLAGLGLTGKSNQAVNEIIYSPPKTEWVDVPAGEFTMGAEVQQGYKICVKEFGDSCAVDFFQAEEPIHSVFIDAYQIMTYEVTNDQYTQCVGNGACVGGGLEYYDQSGNFLGRLTDKKYADHPVVSVSWYQAKSYCEWIGARLPTEAEWEKAARGLDGRAYPWGENINCNYANYGGCVGNTTPVGTYSSGQSPYGAYDMAGNVWEWVADWYGATYYTRPPSLLGDGSPAAQNPLWSNPLGPESGSDRVVRGGSWYVGGDLTRSAYRGRSDMGYSLIGFRCSR